MGKITTAVNYFIVVILCLFMLCAGVRFVTREILIERLGYDGAVAHAIFFDVPEEQIFTNKPNELSKNVVDVDWQKLYPFPKIEVVSAQSRESD